MSDKTVSHSSVAKQSSKTTAAKHLAHGSASAAPQTSMQRMTKQRAAILELLRNQSAFMSAQDLHEILRASGSRIGLATVYRNLQALAESKALDVIRNEETDTQLYRYCAEDEHHHHLVCRCCGKTVDIKLEGFEQWAEEVAADNGFTRVSHSLELYGQCDRCATHGAGHFAQLHHQQNNQ